MRSTRHIKALYAYLYPALLSLLCLTPILHRYFFIDSCERFLLVFFSLMLFLTATFRHLGRFALTVFIPLFLFSAVNVAYQLTTSNLMSTLVIDSVFKTNISESKGFLSTTAGRTYSLYLGGYIFLSICLLISGWKFHRRLQEKSNKFRIFLCITLSLLSLWGYSFYKTIETGRGGFGITNSLSRIYPFLQAHAIYDIFWGKYRNWGQYRKTEFSSLSKTEVKPLSVILVIGESARKKSMGIYGAPYDTTPFISGLANQGQDQIIFFDDVTSAAAFTILSVPIIISTAPIRDIENIHKYQSIYRIFNANKITTSLISNQHPQPNESLISVLFSDIQDITYITPKCQHDEVLLPVLYKKLQTCTRHGVFTLHLQGSHFPYKDRYPQTRIFFPPDRVLNHYLNSIRYTDFILSEIYEFIREKKEPFMLIYTSDHGEYLNEENDGLYGHGYKNESPQEFEIPLFFIPNQAFSKAYPDVVKSLKKGQPLKYPMTISVLLF